MLEVDGSIGGGSILRIAVPIAIATQQELKIFNIRKKRSTPGLRQQHLKGIELLTTMTGSELKGARVGSTTLQIKPGSKEQNDAILQIPTAGAVSLVFQLISNYCSIAKTQLHFEFEGGGTHTQWSPNFDYLSQVTIPALQQFNQFVDIHMHKPGYYPKGGAKGSITVDQKSESKFFSFDSIEGRPDLKIISRASANLEKAKVAERQIQGLMNHGIPTNNTIICYDEVISTGTSLTVSMIKEGESYKGFSALGKKGVRAEDIGRDIANQLSLMNSTASVDEFLADQLMLPLTQAQSKSSYTIPKLTNHVTSNLTLINKLLNNPLKIQESQSYYVIQKI